ncbi:MAG: TonB-dependent receptor, partial [bacterium]|nr:TonB-dependent receptor [bacterium]
KQTMNEAPAIISIITARQIKERGYRTVGEALESVSGIDMIHDRAQYNVGVRGINGGKRAASRIIKVMIDGQPVSFRSSSENFLGEELIPINVVEQIEIIRGPGSALYGANAFLGVFNIITKKGEKTFSADVEGRFKYGTNTLSYGGSAVVTGVMGAFNYTASGTASYADQSGALAVNVPGKTNYDTSSKSSKDTAKPQSYFARIGYTDETLGDFGLDFNFQELDTYAEFQDWGTLTHNNRINLYNLYARTRYANTLIEKFDLNASVTYSRGGAMSDDKLDTDTDTSNRITRDLGYYGIDAALDVSFNIDKYSSLTIGADFTRDTHTIQTFYPETVSTGRGTANAGGTLTGDKKFINMGGYTQAVIYPFRLFNVSLFETFGLTAGLRYDIHNIYDNVLNWRIGGVYQVTDSIYTKVLYGTSFKAPSCSQLYTNYITSGGVIGNANLKPEEAQTVELAAGGR